MEDKTKFKSFIEQMTTRCAKMHEKNQKAAQAFAETGGFVEIDGADV